MNQYYLNLMYRALFEPETLSETEKHQYLYLLQNDAGFKRQVEKLVLKRVGEKMKRNELAQQTPRTYTIEELLQRPLSKEELDELSRDIASYYADNQELERATQICEQLRNNIQLAVNRANGNEMSTSQHALSHIVQFPVNNSNCTTTLEVQLSKALKFGLKVRIMNNKNEIVQDSIIEADETVLSIPLNRNLTIGLYYCVISPIISSPKDFEFLQQYGTETRRFYIHKAYAPDTNAKP